MIVKAGPAPLGLRDLDQNTFNKYYSYSVIDGLLRRKLVTAARFKVGEAVGCKHTAGYLRMTVAGKSLYVHRVIWCMVTGHWPENDIDHVDGNRSNNCWINLREATRQQNCWNSAGSETSELGFKNIYKAQREGCFRVAFKLGNKFLSLGVFDSLTEAITVRDSFAKSHYGEFYHA